MLDNVIIGEGGFTDDYFHKNEWWKDLPEVVGQEHATGALINTTSSKPIDYEQALLEAEGDENDAAAAIAARKEMHLDDNEFRGGGSGGLMTQDESSRSPTSRTPRRSETPMSTTRPSTPKMATTEENGNEEREDEQEEDDEEEEDEDMQLNVGHVDQYMLQFWEREVFGTNLGFGAFKDTKE